MRNTILFMDNEQSFLDSYSDLLEINGYQVVRASTIEQARSMLRDGWVHLAVLDIRMVHEDDEHDISGITLARETAGDGIPKLIMTSYPTYEAVRMALGPSVEGLPASVDFVNKNDGFDVLLEAIHRALRIYQPLNGELQISFGGKQNISVEGLVGILEENHSNALLSYRFEEFRDLLRKLFKHEEQITITRLLWRQEGHMALEVFASGKGPQEHYLLTWGFIDKIRGEVDAFHTFFPKALVTGGISLQNTAETHHYAGFSVAVPRQEDGQVEDLQTFYDYYLNHTDKQVRSVVEHLYENVLRSSLKIRKPSPAGVSLADWYFQHFWGPAAVRPACNWPQVVERISTASQYLGFARIELSDDRIDFRTGTGSSHKLPNPFPYFEGECGGLLPDAHLQFGLSTGGLDSHTLLVDESGTPRISDYCQASDAPIWHDFAAVEASIRYELMGSSSFLDLYQLETALNRVNALGEISLLNKDNLSADARKMAVCLQAARSQAAACTGSELLPYLACLFYISMKDLVEIDPSQPLNYTDTVPMVYRLMTAAAVCEKMTALAAGIDNPSGKAPPVLSLDPRSRSAVVAGEVIALTATEYNLLAYLYQRKGDICTREEIIRDVFNASTPSPSHYNNLNTTFNRLVKTIEPDPDNPIYLNRLAGLGIQLLDKPEP